MYRERDKRMKVSNLAADLSDGFGFFTATVSDISRDGMLLDDVPKKFNDQTKKLTLTFSVTGRNFKILAIPRWISENNQSKSMGIEILDAPSGWSAFVKKHEPQVVTDDVWGAITVPHKRNTRS